MVIHFIIEYIQIKCPGRTDEDLLEKLIFEMDFDEKFRFP